MKRAWAAARLAGDERSAMISSSDMSFVNESSCSRSSSENVRLRDMGLRPCLELEEEALERRNGGG